MGRLFWKIFVAFWIAMLLIAAGAAFTTSRLASAWHDRAVARRDGLVLLADQAGTAYAEAGRAGLERWLREALDREGDYLYIVDHDRAELLGRALPEPIRRLAAGPRRGRGRGHGHETFPPPAAGFDRGSIAMRRIASREDGGWVLIADLGLRSQDMLHSPVAIALRLGVAILLAGIVSFLLARYLTSPVLHLRRTTREFTGGQLDARVGPALGGRRDELADLGRDFDEMAERIGLMLTSQRRLLRDLSHELRSPLARLQVALELARKRAGDSASAELQRIELESERLNQMIGQILSLVRLESDPRSLNRVTVDLQELLASVVEDADFEARAAGRQVALHSTGPLSLAVNDEVLRRAIENIVRNALRHTAEGTTVEVRLEADAAGAAKIRVRDHGPGVAESALSHLFEPFYREAEARGSDPTGFGIGLAIAKRGVEVHGGCVVARNHPDGGLEVEIHLRG